MPRDVEVQRRLSISRVPIHKQDPQERRKNWDEVFLGFDLESAKVEAMRCIQCPTAPCQQACPVGNDIPGAFKLLETGDVFGAAEKFRETSNLPELCGRLCPQERLCEGECVVGVRHPARTCTRNRRCRSASSKRSSTDYQREHEGMPLPGACPDAQRLQRRGRRRGAGGARGRRGAGEARPRLHDVRCLAGARRHPALRHPQLQAAASACSTDKLKYLERLGVKFVGNTWIGKDITVDELFGQGFDAVFVGTGAGVGGSLAIPGEEENSGIYAATEFLVRGNLRPDQLPEHMREPLEIGRNVVVIGGGDTSMDCVRTAVRLGAEHVTCVYRRTETEMLGRARGAPARAGRGRRLRVPDDPAALPRRGRPRNRRRVPAHGAGRAGRVRTAAADAGAALGVRAAAETVAIAIGYNADPLIKDAAPGVSTNRWNLVEVHPETYMTTRPGVFAGGDNVNGADLVVTALADGRRAAQAIDGYLASLPPKRPTTTAGTRR